jgi:hypothetical protein
MSRWWWWWWWVGGGEVGGGVLVGGVGGEVKVMLMVIFFPFFSCMSCFLEKLHTEGGEFCDELFLIEKSLEIAAYRGWGFAA